MADNFNMKQFLFENKLGAYSRLKENEEQLNEYEITYEYGSDGSCYRVDDEGNYDEVDDSYCRRYAGQGVREEKEEMNESFKYFDNYQDFEDTLFQLYPQVKANPEKYKRETPGGGFSYSDGYVNWASWNPNRPQSPSGLPPGAVNMDNKMTASDLIYPPGSRMDEETDKVEETEEKVKEAVSPEAFERMDGLVNQQDVMAYLKSAERIVRTLSDDGFEAREIFDYLHQLVINDL